MALRTAMRLRLKSSTWLVIALFLGAFVLTPSWHVAFARGIHQHDGGAPHDHGDSAPDHGKGSLAHFSILTTPQSVAVAEDDSVHGVASGLVAHPHVSPLRSRARNTHRLRGPPAA